MKRIFVPIEQIAYSKVSGNGALDYIKLHVITTGHKVWPILVIPKEEESVYVCIDGNKRMQVFDESGLWKNVEVFVLEEGDDLPRGYTTKPNGEYTTLGLLENDEGIRVPETELARCDPMSLKIEYRENIHIHYKNVRLVLGVDEFLSLAYIMENV